MSLGHATRTLKVDARHWMRAGHGTAAEARIRRALIDDPPWTEGWVLYHDLLGLKRGRSGVDPLRTSMARRAWVVDARDGHARRLMGTLAFESGRFDLAARHLRVALSNHPSPATAWLFARSLLRLDDRVTAAWFARRARRMPALRATALTMMACFSLRRGRGGAAMALLDRVRRCDVRTLPTGAAAVLTRAEIRQVPGIDRAALLGQLGLGLAALKLPASAPPGPVLAVSGDRRYIATFLDRYLDSVRTAAPDMPVHAHVVGPIDRRDAVEIMDRVDAVTQDTSPIDMNRTYFTVSRFLWLPEIARAWGRAILMTDIDATLAADPRPVLAALPPHAVACRLADHDLPWERTQVTALYLPADDRAITLADHFAAALAARLVDGPLPYYSDQAVLWSLTRSGAYGPIADLTVGAWLRPADQGGVPAKLREMGRVSAGPSADCIPPVRG